MDDHQPGHQKYQPGLEVVTYRDAPQLSSDLDQDKEIVSQTHLYTKPYAPTGPDPPAPPAPTPWWKRRRFIIAVALVVIIALAAALGAVAAGKKGSEGQQGATGDNTSGSSGAGKGSSGAGNGTGTSEGASAQPARAGSPLAATAMRKSDGGLDMRLFFLDRDNHLVSARCDTLRALGDGESCWEMDGSFASYSEPDSQIAATDLVWTSMKPQSELFYTGSGTRLLGVNFNDNTNPRIITDSINDKQWSTGPVSALTAYWPWLVYQDAGGALVHVRNNPPDNAEPNTFWGDSKINVTALMGTRLAMVPVSTNYTRIGSKGGYAVFYQGLDSRLSVSITHLGELGPTYPLSFPTTLPAINLPNKAAIAAFSAARQNDAEQRVDAYVLYIDGSNNINMVYTDSSTAQVTWKTVQPAALRGVDAGTSLACVTTATSGNDERGNAVPLEPVSEGNTCYFQKGGVLMEAKMKGLEWTVQSVVIAKAAKV